MESASSRVICVLGMHRSGTSCLAGTLEQGGLQLGDVQTHNAANLRGNRESPRIQDLHDRILRANGFAWDTPPPPGTELTWSDADRAERDAIIAEFADRRMWGFKDPRTLLALGGWQEALVGLETVGIYRHPLAVARSLQARGDMPLDRALAIWTVYNQRLLAEHRARAIPILSFDGNEDEFRAQVSELGRRLGFPGDLGGETFFAAELRHQKEEDDGSLPADVAEVYAQLRAAAMHVAAAPARKVTAAPSLSIILRAGDDLVPTLQSLRAGYQLGVQAGQYEVIVAGDPALAETVAGFGSGFVLCREDEAPGRARGERLAILTDGAALLSPGLIELAARLGPRAVLTAPAYAFDSERLAQTGWPHAEGSGDRLFDVAQPAEKAGEYRFAAFSRALLDEIGGNVADVQRLAELTDVRWLLAAGEGTFHHSAEGGSMLHGIPGSEVSHHAASGGDASLHSASGKPSIAWPDQPFELHGKATRTARRLLGKPSDLPLALGDGTAVAQLKAKNNELRAKIETLKAKNAELRARGDKWKEKASRR